MITILQQQAHVMAAAPKQLQLQLPANGSAFPSLKACCVKALAAALAAGQLPAGQLHKYQSSLPDGLRREVTAALPLDLELEVALELIPDSCSEWWKGWAAARWASCDPSPHAGSSWKQLCIERNLQEAVEAVEAAELELERQRTAGPASSSPTTRHTCMAHLRRTTRCDAPALLRKVLSCSARFVQHVSLQTLEGQFSSLPLLLDSLQPNLTVLRLSYSSSGGGLDGSGGSGMRLSDCRLLARALATTKALTSLDLSSCGIDDDKARMLASGLADNTSITHLTLSHNRISDRGLRALAKALLGSGTSPARSAVAALDLANNQLQADSGHVLARVLTHSPALRSLTLRLNRLGDEGCSAVLDALSSQCTGGGAGGGSGGAGACRTGAGVGGDASPPVAPALTHLDLAANGAGLGAMPLLCAIMRTNTSLTALDVSGNVFGTRLAADLAAAAGSSRGQLGVLDVRGCGLGEVAERAVEAVMLERAGRAQAAQLCGLQLQE